MATAATVPGVPEVPGGLRLPRLPLIIGTLAMGLGVTAALYYSRLGLTLSHYDAKAHLVVSRRILDSLTPGWEQIGAVWLPLPHLINMLPVQIDFFYRTGLFADITQREVNAVKSRRGWDADGVAGPGVWRALGA